MKTSFIIPCTSIEVQWIIIQQRVDDSLSFMQDEDSYLSGFGSSDDNFFIGLEKITELTQPPRYLQIYLESFDGDVAVLFYGSFSIGNNQLDYYKYVSYHYLLNTFKMLIDVYIIRTIINHQY